MLLRYVHSASELGCFSSVLSSRLHYIYNMAVGVANSILLLPTYDASLSYMRNPPSQEVKILCDYLHPSRISMMGSENFYGQR